MRHKQGQDRNQQALLPESLEEFVGSDDPVRVIDAYIETLDLGALGFAKAVTKQTGRKPYHPGDLLKLYVYGYLNRVSTSRRLERECHRNVEVMWLMRRLVPDFKTIADFRKDNGEAVREACRSFIEFCREAQLLSGREVAIDGSKFKAAASIDQVLTRKHVERDRAEIDRKIEEYLERLDRADEDNAEPGLSREQVQQALEKLKCRSQRLDRFEHGMKSSGRDEHCATEPQARLMRSGRDGMVLGYNTQCAVEAQTGLIVHHEVTDEPGDTRQLLPMAEKTKVALATEYLQVLADAGYANGEHLDRCERQGITATVPRRLIPGSRKGLYQKSDFRYDAEQDRYFCPAGEALKPSGKYWSRNLHLYKRTGCNGCPLQPRCTPSNTRLVTRHFYEGAYDRSQARLAANPLLMHRRMAIGERPFAVMKQIMGFRRFSCRGMSGAKSEMGLAVLGYNLKQMISKLGVPRMLELMA
jgi:transposase